MSDNASNASNNPPVFDILRIYAKDSSLETPNIPAIFQKEWKPEIKIDFDNKSNKLNEESYEVSFRVTVTCKIGEEVAFICEVNQAGIFLVRNITDQNVLNFLLNGVAPNTLYPYARELISRMVSSASFPPLYLRPINFEAEFHNKVAQAQASAAQAANDQKPQA